MATKKNTMCAMLLRVREEEDAAVNTNITTPRACPTTRCVMHGTVKVQPFLSEVWRGKGTPF